MTNQKIEVEKIHVFVANEKESDIYLKALNKLEKFGKYIEINKTDNLLLFILNTTFVKERISELLKNVWTFIETSS